MIRKKKRIAIFCWRDYLNPRAGGAEHVTKVHAQHWILKGYEVVWFSSKVHGQPQKFTRDGIKFIRAGSEKLFFFVASIQYLLHNKLHFDIVIDQAHGIPNFCPLWTKDTKTILLIHEVAGDIWDYMFPKPISYIGKLIERLSLKLFYTRTKIWVDSKSTALDLQKLGLKSTQISIISCGIDEQIVSKEIKEKDLTLIFLSRIVKMKGIEFALTVFELVQEIIPAASLWIAGSGEDHYIEKIKKQVLQKNLQRVYFLGKISEVMKYKRLRRSHFLLHTSIKEGFGLTVLEANSQYTPAAIFDVGSLNELVEDSITGVVAPFHNERLLANKIILAYQNKKKYNEMCERAYVYQKPFRWQNFTKQSTQLLEEI